MKKRLTINFGVLELSRWNAVVKEQINLTKSAVFGLRKAEPAPNIAQQVRASVKEARLGSPVPSYEG